MIPDNTTARLDRQGGDLHADPKGAHLRSDLSARAQWEYNQPEEERDAVADAASRDGAPFGRVARPLGGSAGGRRSDPGAGWRRAGVGLDVIDLGLAGGVGAGYRFSVGSGTAEALVDVYYSPYWETYTEGSNTFNYSTTLIIVGVRANWLFNYPSQSKGLYELVGTGFFVGSYSWENYNITTDYTEGNGYVASGTILNLGLG